MSEDIQDFSANLIGIWMPSSIRALPVDPVRKVPVPWFVAWINDKPEFRCMEHEKLVQAVKERRCWVCGEKMGDLVTYVIGPMCSINRVSAEPPSHHECALFSVKACPFLSKPHMHRREGGLPEDAHSAGFMIKRNPGCMALWTTREVRPFDDGRGGTLFNVGVPAQPVIPVTWWAQGRPATRAEVEASIASGLPTLMDQAKREGPDAVDYLEKLIVKARAYLPAA